MPPRTRLCLGARTGLVTLLALLLTACGDDPAPKPTVPAWAKVAPEQIAEAEKHGVPVVFENDLGMRFVLIPAGTFLMGLSEDEEGRTDDEPQHEVTISKPFYMSIHEVTNGQYRCLVADHECRDCDGHTINEDVQPAVDLSHTEAEGYARWLSRTGGDKQYALPTEAQWEYACRAGTKTRYWWGESLKEAGTYANVLDLTARQVWPDTASHVETEDHHAVAAPVGSYRPNRWGLYDMLGNAWEYCADWCGPYSPAGQTDPRGPTEAQSETILMHSDKEDPGVEVRAHVERGGSWYAHPENLGCGCRWCVPCDVSTWHHGFRLVSPLPEPCHGGRDQGHESVRDSP